MNNKSHKIFLIFMNLLRNLISSHHRDCLWPIVVCSVCASRVVKIKMHSLILWFIYCDISHAQSKPTEFRLGWCQGFFDRDLPSRSIVISRETWNTIRMHLKGAIWVCVIINQTIWVLRSALIPHDGDRITAGKTVCLHKKKWNCAKRSRSL